jgi:putative DNA methylase
LTNPGVKDSNQNKPSLEDAPCFIELQFPVAKLSMESYKERKAGASQTLTGLGKWWGRKPLVLVRAALLGLLMPVSDNPEMDRDIFLKLMTMDSEGLWRRKNKSVSQENLIKALQKMPPSVKHQYLFNDELTGIIQLRSFNQKEKEQKEELQRIVFDRMPYGEKLEYCLRPEQIDGPSLLAWQEINAYFGTQASNLFELVRELGLRRFGQIPRIGDAFCGGGSVPFESARMGCEVYGSDLNPMASLLTWASLHLIGGGEEVSINVDNAQHEIYRMVDRKITEMGIEHNSMGWRADSFLYCVEVIDPESGWKVPLLPTLAIASKTRAIAKLIPDEANKRYDILILENVAPEEYEAAEKSNTISDLRLVPPNGGASTPIEVIRKDLRMWEKDDIIPRVGDVFQERLYCIRWVESYIGNNGKTKTLRHYRAPTSEDFTRERQVLSFVQDHFHEWQERGFIPSRPIEHGEKTDEPIRTRGWTYWHHLFNPRQLLILGLFAKSMDEMRMSQAGLVSCLLLLGKLANNNSKLVRWGIGKEEHKDVFSNQALNTLYNYVATYSLSVAQISFRPQYVNLSKSIVYPVDARQITIPCSIWITDPPYADAVNYHELSEFFLAWLENQIPKLFPEWYNDSKRALAVKGNDISFRQAMVDSYKQLTEHMPENGLQIVMFTHQDAAVWADLTLILWAAGLRVTAAWTIATETESSLKEGNYVQGTVILVLRKRMNAEPIFLDEINHKVENEVRRQLDSMTALEDSSDPNFGDADYQLAAYAAALRVLTERPIEEIDPEKEILRHRQPGEVSAVEQLIRRAVKIACDHLIPRGLDPDLWKQLGPMERFYLKGLEVESHAEYRSGVYQELARGFGATDYDDLLATTKANETRLKSASEFAKKMLSGEGFASTLVRQVLFAIFLTVQEESTKEGLNWLHTELNDYWGSREKIVHILEYLSPLRFATPMVNWEKDANAAALLTGAVRNDHV